MAEAGKVVKRELVLSLEVKGTTLSVRCNGMGFTTAVRPHNAMSDMKGVSKWVMRTFVMEVLKMIRLQSSTSVDGASQKSK